MPTWSLLSTGQHSVSAMSGFSPSGRCSLLILYASETGNAHDVAERVGREAARRHYTARVVPMDSFSLEKLGEELYVVMVVATTGQGDPPHNMKRMWRSMLRKKLGPTCLVRTKYAVFGLGDSGYPKYNVAAKKLDRRMIDLGASPLMPRGLGDDQHPSGYEASLDPWLASLWSVLRGHVPLPPSLGDPPAEEDAMPTLDPPKLRVTFYHNDKEKLGAGQNQAFAAAAAIANGEAAAAAARMWAANEKALEMLNRATACAGDQELPFRGQGAPQMHLARMVRNERLTAAAHSQDVRHIEFDISACSGLEYKPGDVLNMMPAQAPEAVEAREPSYEAAAAAGGGGGGGGSSSSEAVRVADLVEAALDINSASPRRYFFEVLSHFATEEREVERLQYFATAEGRDDLHRYNQREGRTVLEVLEDFPSAEVPLEWLLQIVPRLQPRAFSISSSLRAHPGQAHITVAVVEWRTPFKRTRKGLCSTWLSTLAPSHQGKDVCVPVWVSRGALRLPAVDVPLILVGPGTGCAPFRAFVEERSLLDMAISSRADAAACNGSVDAGALLQTLHSSGMTRQVKQSSGAASSTCENHRGQRPMVGDGVGSSMAGRSLFAAKEAEAEAVLRREEDENSVDSPGGGSMAAIAGPVLFFFGCRYKAKDFLYQEEWLAYTQPPGVMSEKRGGGLVTAFSRDQPSKIYVQHRMNDRSRDVWKLLMAGASVYVAGSATKMPADVIAALQEVVRREGVMSEEDAAKWVKGLERVGRLCIEAWS
eukprot:jgi/Mesen1/9384/ME000610S08681